jgi:hypothetical protein
MKLKLLAVAAALALAATGAHATTVLSDNFDSENGGATALQYTGFANFNVTGTGVDIVGTPNVYGITCAGGGGSCVDLDGSPGPGGLITKTAYTFNAGDLVKLSFQIAGNQRDSDPNSFFAGFQSGGGNISAINYTLGGAYGNSVPFPTLLFSSVDTTTSTTGGSQPFETYTLSFEALQTGSVEAFIGTQDPGNVGPLLDNVSLSISAVPEPATWAMMLLGVGMIGAGVRMARRRTDLSPTAA